MADSRLVQAALRCYPARWRQRHGAEAAELAALLIQDGTPAASIAWSYLVWAAREWLTPPPGRRLSAMACALLVAASSLGISAGVLATASPARAANQSPPAASPSCSPASAIAVPAAPAAASQQRITWVTGHGRSC
jgi:hypothetical protein